MNVLHKLDTSNAVAVAAALSKDTFRQIAAIFAQNEAREARIETDRQWFIQGVAEKGYSTPEEFLTLSGFTKTEPVKRTRTTIDPVKRVSVIEAVKVGKTTKEIVTEFGVTADAVYSIKSKAGLTTKRNPKVTPTVPTELAPLVPTTEKVAAYFSSLAPNKNPIRNGGVFSCLPPTRPRL